MKKKDDGFKSFDGYTPPPYEEEESFSGVGEIPAYLNDEVQALAENKYESTIGGPKVAVKLMNPVVYEHDGKECYFVVTVDAPVTGYLVETSKIENSRVEQWIDLNEAYTVYDWSNELEFLYPDIETIRQNALLSFWRAGALHLKDLENSAVRRNLFGSAYPYRMP